MSSRPRAVAIVQARFGSSRLRGKVLEPLGDRTVLAEVLERCRQIAGIDLVCCAVAESADSDPVAAEAARTGAVVIRGAEEDVLSRYHQAAGLLGAEVILRVTSDCPYLDPVVAAAVLRLVTEGGHDYAGNNLPPSWPHGLDCEAVRRSWLDRATAEAAAADDREHVTLWIRRHPAVRRANLASPDRRLAGFRWTVDHCDDLTLARDVFARLPADPRRVDYRTVLGVIAADPALWRRARYAGTSLRPSWSCAPETLAAVAQVAVGRLAA